LSVADGRSSIGKQSDLIKKCMKFIDPNNSRDSGLIFGHHGMEDEEFDAKAAKAALQKNGYIANIYEFSEEYDGEERDGYPWSVNSQCKKSYTKDEASEELEKLFEGESCPYPENYDNFGSTPFTPDDSCDVDGDGEEELKTLQKQVLSILEKATIIEHSCWEGESGTEENCALILREDLFFFSGGEIVGSTKFLLTFGWRFQNDG
jgi:hypothetical protein